MGTKFGRYYPAIGGAKQANEKERLLFIAAAGLAFSLLVVVAVIFNFRSTADAGLTQPANVPVPAAIGTVTLLTPDRPIRAGTRLSDVSFKEVYWPRNQVPEGAVRDIAELKSFYAKGDLAPGVPIQRSALTKEPLRMTLPLTPGNRAVTIEVDATSGLEGHALPGTRVDVVLTAYEAGQLSSKVIVQNARVLSYGGDFTPLENRLSIAAARTTSKTLTLEVSPKDALQIQTARQLGRLSLLMRTADDVLSPQVTRIDQRQIQEDDAGNEPRKRACTKGTVKIDGRQFVMNCDGSMSQLVNPDEP